MVYITLYFYIMFLLFCIFFFIHSTYKWRYQLRKTYLQNCKERQHYVFVCERASFENAQMLYLETVNFFIGNS